MSKCLNKQSCPCNPIREGGRYPISPGQAHRLRQRQAGQESGRAGQGSPCRQRSKSAGGRPGGLPEAGNVGQSWDGKGNRTLEGSGAMMGVSEEGIWDC